MKSKNLRNKALTTKTLTTKTVRTVRASTVIHNCLRLTASALLALGLAFSLVACDNTPQPATSGNSGTGNSGTAGNNNQSTTLVVGASVTPHAEILKNIQSDLAAEGVELKIIEYTDYVKPNLDTDTGDTAANYFQHKPYLDEFNSANNTKLVPVVAIHFEPLAIYPGSVTSLAALPDGAKVAVPNDVTNEARALQLLAAEGLITLPANADLTITPKDIVSNPKNLSFVEVDAAAVPRQLQDVAIGVINGNNALAAGLDVNTALASEDPESQAAQTYANVLVVKSGQENDPAIQKLVKALTSDKTRKFIDDNYKGVVVPVF